MDNIPHMLRIHALGALRVESPAGPLHLHGARVRRPLELLLALIAAGAPGVGQHLLCESLWPDSEGDAAYRALITTVYRLRRWLGCHDAVSFAAGRVALSARQCWVDAWTFEESLGGAAGEDRAAVLTLYSGSLLAEFDSPFALDARERLRRKFIRTVLCAVEQLEQPTRFATAIALCEHAVEVEPACEELHRRLIVVLGRQGQATAARSAYRRCQASLLRHFGTRPSEATERALRDACAHPPASHFSPFAAATSPLAL